MGRQGLRTFALARMSKVAVATETFPRPKDFSIEKYLKGSFGIFTGDADIEVVVEFDAWAAAMVRERKWHPSQQIDDLGHGGLRLTLRLSNLPEIERWVLSWGVHAMVIRPQAMRDNVQKIAAEMAVRYQLPIPVIPMAQSEKLPQPGLPLFA